MVFSANVLIIDNEESTQSECIKILKRDGHRIRAVENGNKGLDRINRESFDVVILELNLSDIPGIELLRKIRENDPNSIVIAIAEDATIDSAVEAMKNGAFDFLPKPFTPEGLSLTVKKAVDFKLQALREACIVSALEDRIVSKTLIGKSDEIKKISILIQKIATSNSTVLITGETGAGKGLVAQIIHNLGKRYDKPFVTVDCGSLVETLFESELFGHVKGSYTGASETTRGKFELANGGTIFLDEISNININMQSRLLKVIEDQEISLVGSTEKIKLDIRIISATNKDLLAEINEGRFREDLFYRLNVVPLHIPPLRNRREDIPLLVNHFLGEINKRNEKEVKKIADDAMRSLEMYDWPGNVRELKNIIERGVVTCDGSVFQLDDIHYDNSICRTGNNELTHGNSLSELEREKIIEVLKQFNWNKTKAAEYLSISRKTLRDKIRKYVIPEP